jgi:hypothetical protein
MTVCMKSTPAQRRGFLLIGIGDTASRTRVLDCSDLPRQKATPDAVRNNRCAVDASPFSTLCPHLISTASISLTDETHSFQTSLIVVSALIRALGQLDF